MNLDVFGPIHDGKEPKHAQKSIGYIEIQLSHKLQIRYSFPLTNPWQYWCAILFQKVTKMALTGHFFLNQTSSYNEKFLFWFSVAYMLTTTWPYLPRKMIDPLDPWGHPQGVPQFQLQYVKLNTPAHIAILILFTYMVVNGV